jgi:2,5-diketo-D-gluconate reductase B
MSFEVIFHARRDHLWNIPLTGTALGSAVEHAKTAGYRAFDTAQIYGNERDLGVGLQRLGRNRADFSVTTKIAPPNYTERNFCHPCGKA